MHGSAPRLPTWVQYECAMFSTSMHAAQVNKLPAQKSPIESRNGKKVASGLIAGRMLPVAHQQVQPVFFVCLSLQISAIWFHSARHEQAELHRARVSAAACGAVQLVHAARCGTNYRNLHRLFAPTKKYKSNKFAPTKKYKNNKFAPTKKKWQGLRTWVRSQA